MYAVYKHTYKFVRQQSKLTAEYCTCAGHGSTMPTWRYKAVLGLRQHERVILLDVPPVANTNVVFLTPAILLAEVVQPLPYTSAVVLKTVLANVTLYACTCRGCIGYRGEVSVLRQMGKYTR